MFTKQIPCLTEMEVEILREYCEEMGIQLQWKYDYFGLTVSLTTHYSRQSHIDFVLYLTNLHMTRQEHIRDLLARIEG